jgi:hypothetical protein
MFFNTRICSDALAAFVGPVFLLRTGVTEGFIVARAVYTVRGALNKHELPTGLNLQLTA